MIVRAMTEQTIDARKGVRLTALIMMKVITDTPMTYEASNYNRKNSSTKPTIKE
jgi:hypothetical protein